MSKIMELADAYVQLSRHYYSADAPEVVKARDALAAEVSKLHQERDALREQLDTLQKAHDSLLLSANLRVGTALSERDAAEDQVAALSKDAARYRWLRDNCTRIQAPMLGVLLCVPDKWLPEHQTTTQDDDAAIDADIAAKGEAV
jgi:cell division septum initiation protein DivIVA